MVFQYISRCIQVYPIINPWLTSNICIHLYIYTIFSSQHPQCHHIPMISIQGGAPPKKTLETTLVLRREVHEGFVNVCERLAALEMKVPLEAPTMDIGTDGASAHDLSLRYHLGNRGE